MVTLAYEREDLGFTFTVSPLGELITDPGFKPGEWFVKHTDREGLFMMQLEDELCYLSGNDPVWDTMVKAVFSPNETVVLLFKVGETEREEHMLTLLHRSAAAFYILVDSL